MRCIPFFYSAVLFGRLATLSVPAQAGLVGNWDCVLSGNQQGVAHLFFDPSGSLSGRALFTFSGKSTGVFTNRGVVFTNFFGGARLHGQWSYESPTRTNRVVGFINAVSSRAGSTAFITNGLSFRGTVRGSKMTLLALGDPGKVTLRGIPLMSTNDLSGNYYATGQKRGYPGPFAEVFNMAPAPEIDVVTNTISTPFDCSTTVFTISTNSYSTTNFDSVINVTNYITYVTITQQTCVVTSTNVLTFPNDFPANYYSITGAGAAYEYTGRFLLSRQKYAAFFQGRGVDNEFITVYAGPFNPATGRGSLIGTDGVNRNIRFAIYHGPQ